MANKNLTGRSADIATPAVKGEFTGTGETYVHDGGKGVQGHSQNGWGVYGFSEIGRGVVASSDTNYGLRATSRTLSAARCSSAEGSGVEGEAGSSGDGVRGTSISGNGVHGISDAAFGVLGESKKGRGVVALSDTNYGLRAVSRTLSAARCSSAEGSGIEGEAGSTGDGVRGVSKKGNGVIGASETGRGVAGFSNTWQGVYGHSISQAGVVGESDQYDGVFGISHHPQHAGVSGHNPGGMAGYFDGDVVVTGDIRLGNADFAEDFDVTDVAEPGDVMVLTATAALEPSAKSYDTKVVGVISGAGNYKPGIILDKQNNVANRKPIAMMGKVYCKVEADSAPVNTGDMLTTSAVPGYAMKANDPLRAFGAVIGKALMPLPSGKGLIPILIALQ